MTDNLEPLELKLQIAKNAFVKEIIKKIDYLCNKAAKNDLERIYLTTIDEEGISETYYITKEGIISNKGTTNINNFVSQYMQHNMSYIGFERQKQIIKELRHAEVRLEEEIMKKQEQIASEQAKKQEEQKPDITDISGTIKYYLKK